MLELIKANLGLILATAGAVVAAAGGILCLVLVRSWRAFRSK